MSTKSNLDFARKCEWNAAMARSQNNQYEADRYDYMAKMAMIDAAVDVTRDINTKEYISSNDQVYYSNSSVSIKEFKNHKGAVAATFIFVILSCAFLLAIEIFV